jgi:hypothetical protein
MRSYFPAKLGRWTKMSEDVRGEGGVLAGLVKGNPRSRPKSRTEHWLIPRRSEDSPRAGEEAVFYNFQATTRKGFCVADLELGRNAKYTYVTSYAYDQYQDIHL